jgi:hypothetical protein
MLNQLSQTRKHLKRKAFMLRPLLLVDDWLRNEERQRPEHPLGNPIGEDECIALR